jgi:hypothetical protein
LVAPFQLGGGAGTNGAAAGLVGAGGRAGEEMAAMLDLGEERGDIAHQGVKLGQTQPGERAEDGRISAQIIVACYHTEQYTRSFTY